MAKKLSTSKSFVNSETPDKQNRDNTNNLKKEIKDRKTLSKELEKELKIRKELFDIIKKENEYIKASLKEKQKMLANEKELLSVSKEKGKIDSTIKNNLTKAVQSGGNGLIPEDFTKALSSVQKLLPDTNTTGQLVSQLGGDLLSEVGGDLITQLGGEFLPVLSESLVPAIGGELTTVLAGPVGAIIGAIEVVGSIMASQRDELMARADAAYNLQTQYMGRMESRLQGINNDWYDYIEMADKVSDKLMFSSVLSVPDFMGTIAKLSDAGIAYNLEQRALVQELADKMVSTFDAMDSSLTRLIRLQQTDLTYAALGTESELTWFLNSMFKDTSYLGSSGGSGLYDTVNAAMVDALSQMDREQATSYSYAVQKWLGSLYSVGMSTTAVETIAKGLNALSTGDINTLNGSSSLQNLLALSAQNAGLSYSSMLTQGMNATDVNKLMKSMVEYLSDIADNTDSKVVKSEWANITGLSVSDYRALSNLTNTDIANIYQSSIDYAGAINEYNTQLDAVWDRTSTAQKLENLLANYEYSWADNFVSSGGYSAGKLSQFGDALIDKWSDGFGIFGGIVDGIVSGIWDTITGGITSFFGTAADIETLGHGLEYVVGSLGSLLNGDGLMGIYREMFGSDTFLERGAGFTTNAGVSTDLVTTGLSQSAQVVDMANSVGDAVATSMAQNANISTYSYGSTETETSIVRTASDIYARLFDDQRAIRVQLAGVEPSATEQLNTSSNSALLKAIKEDLDYQNSASEIPTSNVQEDVSNTISSVKSGNSMTNTTTNSNNRPYTSNAMYGGLV